MGETRSHKSTTPRLSPGPTPEKSHSGFTLRIGKLSPHRATAAAARPHKLRLQTDTQKHTVFSQCSLTCESIENRVESAVSAGNRRPRVRTREKHKTPAVGPAGVSLLLLIFFSLNGLP